MDKRFIILSYVCFASSVVAASYRRYNLTDKDIRLVGGYSDLEGRVEIRKHGVWGTVCSYGFGVNAANVLCRMLHKDLRSLEYYIDGRYGDGRGPIFYTYLICSGSEESIYNCSQYSSSSCTHSNDIGLMCVGCPNATLETPHGLLEHVNITNFGDVYSGPCMRGLSKQEFMFTCTPLGGWIEHINDCTNNDIRDIRLTGKSDYYMEGFVEALIGDTWLPLCGTTIVNRQTYYISSTQTDVLCSKFGMTSKTYSGSMKTLQSPGVILSKCFGNETNVNHCRHFIGHVCQYQTWIACKVSGDTKHNIKAIHLENGSSPYDGRIALYVDNVIGSVCFDSFDYEDAKVVCRMFGFSASSYYVDVHAIVQDRYALIKDLACNGYENHINNCSYTWPSSLNKCKYKPTRVLCVDCGRLDVQYGIVQSFDYRTNTVIVRCQTDNPRTVQYICNRNGTWTKETSCRPIQIQEIRLVGINSSLLAGTVEIKINNVWGTIYADELGYSEARVLCGMMNYRYRYIYAGFGPGTGTIHMGSLRCTGSEKNINECVFTNETTWSYANDAGIICGDYGKVNITGVRLVDGSGKSNGIVELLHGGVWRSLCGSLYQPDKLCSSLNMTYLSHRCCSKHEHRSGLIYSPRLWCYSTNTYIGECRYDSYYYVRYLASGSCGGSNILVCSECPKLNVSMGSIVYSDDGATATLLCNEGYFSNITSFRCQGGNWSDNNITCILSPPLNVTHVRLADGFNSNAGRLEIAVKNAYGTVCAKDFSFVDGDIACKSINMSYRVAAVYNVSYFGPGSGQIYIDQLDCTSSRNHIKDCYYRKTGICDHSNDVSLVCSECGKPVTVLDDRMFQFNDSNVVMYGDCSFYKSYVGQLRAICDKGTWTTLGNCIEYSKPMNVQGVRLVNGRTHAEGRVEMKVFATWGTVCSAHFGMKEAEVVCRMMGYLRAQSFTGIGSSGVGTGPIFIDKLNCGNDASHINDCEYTTYHNCSHDQDVSVACSDCDNVEVHEGRILTHPVITTVNATLTFSCNEGFEMLGADTIKCERTGKWSSSPPTCMKKSNMTVLLAASVSSGTLIVTAIIAVSVFCFKRRRNRTLSNNYRKSIDRCVTTKPNTYLSSVNTVEDGANQVYVNSGMDSSNEDYVELDDVTPRGRITETERQKSTKTTAYEQLFDSKRTIRSNNNSGIDRVTTNMHNAGPSSRIAKPKGNRK
ncbi:hypothetical protein DPMN_111229 [Dreissena polymorpha]|uniref:Uncharacterized protein n=1 Tax=Dreissena polymorpha TaxID=45954 RepID=A0A9D4KE24_DREPO|nr:hypothetical protein DPMN_111229 [Dreissena polymorpha]